MRTWLKRGLFAVALMLLVAIVGGYTLLETPWGRDRLRVLAISQAGRFLNGTLSIGSLEGSLLRGAVLNDVKLALDGRTVVSIDRVTVGYVIRELYSGGTVIRSLELDGPRISAQRGADGRWDLLSLVRRDPNRPSSPGGRVVRLDRVEVRNGDVSFSEPLSTGGMRFPSRFANLNTSLAYQSRPQAWSVTFSHLSFAGTGPELDINQLSGTLENENSQWRFLGLHVVTPSSDLTVGGSLDRRRTPASFDLALAAPRFRFQDWSGVVGGLRNMAVDSSFDAKLQGTPAALRTVVTLRSNGGDVNADVVLNTATPGWHSRGRADVRRLNLARWLNQSDKASDISGNIQMDVDLHLGGHFPSGAFVFAGSHAAYAGYAADDLSIRGTLTDVNAEIAYGTATAYGANVRLGPSRLGLDRPFPFRFTGFASSVDLRQVPETVPVPHVESVLAFDFDVTGRFQEAFIQGQAAFADSTFLGASLAQGATGSIDTLASPFRYEGAGDLTGVDLGRFGRDLEVTWLQDPKYAGTLAGHFSVAGSGSDAATMTLESNGRVSDARLFNGQITDADVSLHIESGSLSATLDGTLTKIDPAVPLADQRWTAELSGKGRGRIHVADLLVRSPALADYSIESAFEIADSRVRDIALATGQVQLSMADGTLKLSRVELDGPLLHLQTSGTLELDDERSSRLAYEVQRLDLTALRALTDVSLEGNVTSAGEMTGRLSAPRLVGKLTGDNVVLRDDVRARSTSLAYDLTVDVNDPARSFGQTQGTLTDVVLASRRLDAATVAAAYGPGRSTMRVTGTLEDGTALSVDAAGAVDVDAKRVVVQQLDASIAHTAWRLRQGADPARISWDGRAITIGDLSIVDSSSGRQRIDVAGTWNFDSGGTVRVTASGVSLDTLTATTGGQGRYGGTVELTADIAGTPQAPRVAAEFTIVDGRVERLPLERVNGRVNFSGDLFDVNVRVEQSPGVWLTAVGTVPMNVFDAKRPDLPMNVKVQSSQVSLTLLEGVTNLVRNVSGNMELDVTVEGTSRDPHFSGKALLQNAAFDVVPSGARYRNGRLQLQLGSDRVVVEAFHVEDEAGHALDLTGSLGTRARRVSDLQVVAVAKSFEVLRNDYGRMSLDAQLQVSGEFESPRITGRLVATGGSINVDQVLDRVIFRPYSTEAQTTALDPIAVLNPWERMGMDIELHIPGTLRMVGDNVQVSPGTPLGLGNINLRVFGDLYLYKDPAQPMYVNGSLDSLTGTYVFQGRRFDLDPSSSVNFRGDLTPELYVRVGREISGVQTRVEITGALSQPELRLSSTPPLEPSEVLSLIVFNTTTNELSALQQQQLAVRAGALAAGFLVAPMMSALERTLGIDTLEIEPGADVGGGARVTVGNEIAPGLVARFSRQFGENTYDEATLEYYLSRLLRIRATFSDASSLTVRSPFRRVERAGIDLLLFFSF